MIEDYRNIIISFIIGLLIDIISFYLFTIKTINLQTLISIIAGSILLVMILAIQTKYNEVKEEIKNIKADYKQLNESLKMNDRLTKLELKVEKYERKRPC